ncbi:MAG: sugar-binding protein, partial [Fibrobacterota bacterium]
LKAQELKGTVLLDGRLEESAWQKAPVTKGFVESYTGNIARHGASARVLYDNEAVYIGIVSPGNFDWIDAAPFPDLYKTETIEIFINPLLETASFFKFSVNRYGRQACEKYEQCEGIIDGKAVENWRGEWTASVCRGKEGWSVEVRIPYSTLGVPEGRPGCAWGFNLSYSIPTEKGLMLWTNWSLLGSHHQPKAFGALVFSEKEFAHHHRELWEDVKKGEISRQSRIGGCVFIDYDAPGDERYKMSWRVGESLYAAVSSDGIDFETRARILDSGSLDTMNICFRDPRTKKYNIYTRWWYKGSACPAYPDFRRAVARMTSDSWTKGWSEREVVNDPKNLPGSDGYWDIYTPSVFVYENLYVALPTVHYRNIDLGPLSISLQVSTDGVHWNWLGGGAPVIRRSDSGWDSGALFSCVPPVLVDDRLHLYYTGLPTQHEEPRCLTREGSGAIGVATLRRDGFCCRYGEHRSPGYVMTGPLIFHQGDNLYLNVKTIAEKGELRVEILGNERLGAEACIPVKGDDTFYQVKWEKAGFSELKGRSFRIKFYLNGAKLYAFEVK